MTKGLKIYGCTGLRGIGSNSIPQQYDYWTDNTSSVENTQAVNTMFSFINSAIIDITYLQLSDEEIQYKLRDIDLWAVALYYADKYKNNNEELLHVGRVISRAKKAGLFDFDSIDNAERDAHLDDVFAQIESALERDEDELSDPDAEFMKWWDKYIISRNKRGFSESDAQLWEDIVKRHPIKGIGDVNWSENPTLAKYFNDCGGYFLYTYFSDEQLKELPYLFTKKAKVQKQYYKEAKKLFLDMQGSEEEMQDVIRHGIITQYNAEPSEIVNKIAASYKEPGVGALGIDDIIAIVSLIVTLLVGVLTAILEYKAKKYKAEMASTDPAVIDQNCPGGADYDGLNFGQNSGLSAITTKLFSGVGIWIVAALAGGLLLFSSRKK